MSHPHPTPLGGAAVDGADHDFGGMAHDLPRLFGRRRALQLLAGASLLAVVGCGSDDAGSANAAGSSDPSATSGGTSSASSSTSPTTAAGASASSAGSTTATGSCDPIPEETAGPYPGDGSNGPDVLGEQGVVRRDIRSSFGGASGVAAGVPLTVTLRLLDSSNGCAPLAGGAVYLWHCDREGRYSLYSQGVTGENYLRGVQGADEAGELTFVTTFPGAYAGRWPHIHFEVYPTVASAASVRNQLATSQLALPQDACEAAYATDGYSTSVRNLAQTPLARDNVFRDGYDQQLATVTGNATDGFVATLDVTV